MTLDEPLSKPSQVCVDCRKARRLSVSGRDPSLGNMKCQALQIVQGDLADSE